MIIVSFCVIIETTTRNGANSTREDSKSPSGQGGIGSNVLLPVATAVGVAVGVVTFLLFGVIVLVISLLCLVKLKRVGEKHPPQSSRSDGNKSYAFSKYYHSDTNSGVWINRG